MNSSSFTVTVRRGRFGAQVTVPDAGTAAILRRAVPSPGREFLPESRRWLVHGTRVPGLLAAFRDAGIPVEIVDTSGGAA